MNTLAENEVMVQMYVAGNRNYDPVNSNVKALTQRFISGRNWFGD